jgi:hypothetical protein
VRSPPDAEETAQPGGPSASKLTFALQHKASVDHDPTGCRTCDPGVLVYLTTADEWRRWAIDHGHTIGSRAVA